jgi:SH3-like domain-containing protein
MKLPPGALAFIPTEELSFRTQPVISPETVIRRVPPTEMLASIEPAKAVIAKVGVTNQWLKVRDASNKDGYVAAWYVKYASGSQDSATTTAAPTTPAPGGILKVKATAEAIALRKQPVVSDASLIYRLPLGTVFTVTEPNAEGKVGKNDQWLKVKDPNGAEGYVAAWFVAR